jgi:3-oxoacyl-[acyl-carrier protein] reductase
VALVTGGTRGIGAAVSRVLVEAGARVFSVYRDDEAAAGALLDVVGAGERLTALRSDVTVVADLDALFERVDSDAGGLDILVNVAGQASDGLLLRAGPDKVRAALAVNLEATVSCCRLALVPMLEVGRGRIVNISSVVAAMGNSGQSVYAAAKAGVEGFTRSLAREVGAKGVTVNCVSPGLIDTEMTNGMEPELRRRAIDATALGREGTPAEVAGAVAYLVSDAAAYVTGAVLQVNGGMYM